MTMTCRLLSHNGKNLDSRQTELLLNDEKLVECFNLLQLREEKLYNPFGFILNRKASILMKLKSKSKESYKKY